MNDLQKLASLFMELDIEHKIEQYEDERWGSVCAIRIDVDNNNPKSKVKGYEGFSNSFMFDEKDKFIRLNIWE